MKKSPVPVVCFAVLIVMFGLMVSSSILSAQNQPTAGETTVEFYGTVQSTSRTSVSINGQVIDVASAQLNMLPVIGSVVRVSAVIQPDGVIVARQVDPVPIGVIPGIVVLTGRIAGTTESAIFLDNQVIQIANALVLNPIQTGSIVRVLAVADAPGSWRALMVGSPDAAAFAPLGTPDPSLFFPNATPEVGSTPLSPVSTPELNVIPPVSTPDVDDDDDRDDDNSGSGSDDDNDDDDDDSNDDD